MNRSPLIDSAVEILRQGEQLLQTLDDEKYTRRLPAVFTSAIGGHYRHCLDHFQCLLAGVAEGEVNYDHRRRDTRIENDRAFALAETRRLQDVCARIPAVALRVAPERWQQGELRRRSPLGLRFELRAGADVRRRARNSSLRSSRRDVWSCSGCGCRSASESRPPLCNTRRRRKKLPNENESP